MSATAKTPETRQNLRETRVSQGKKKDYKQSWLSILRRTIISKSEWYSRRADAILPEKAGEAGL